MLRRGREHLPGPIVINVYDAKTSLVTSGNIGRQLVKLLWLTLVEEEKTSFSAKMPTYLMSWA
jgi:hypothetical protein